MMFFAVPSLTTSELELLQLQTSVTAIPFYVGHYNLWRLLHMSTSANTVLPRLVLTVSRAHMGVVRQVFGNPYVPLYVCHTLYACDGRQHQILAKLVFLRISCEVKIYRHAIGITKRPALLFRSSIVS